MGKVFDDFFEVEEEVRKFAPPILYKYRDWQYEFNKSIVTDNVAWFAHPKDLNDKYDIRVPVRFDANEVHQPEFYQKLRNLAKMHFPHLNPSSRDFDVICENQLEFIKADPIAFFQKNYLELRESDHYDQVGVFSLTGDPLNETMWAHYANNTKGFCIGFDTIKLIKSLPPRIGFGYVDYDEEPPYHLFTRSSIDNQKSEMYFKFKKWENENEFRLLTFSIGHGLDRGMKFDKDSISEIIVGADMPSHHLDKIIEVLKVQYDSRVKLFRTIVKPSSYGYDREPLDY